VTKAARKEELAERLEQTLLIVPDFPKPGIQFRDITPLLTDTGLFGDVIDWMAEVASSSNYVAGIESRGFVFASPVAFLTSRPLLLFRKPGKLPRETVSATFQKEYGPDSLHLHTGSVKAGQTVTVIDDVLATGGTAMATKQILESLGAKAHFAFLVELKGLGGREKLGDSKVECLVSL
jgi:adenine phosphoribosyltransferase